VEKKSQMEREDSTADMIAKVQSDLEGQLKRVENDTNKQIKSIFEVV
jgi:hypothetical protein